MGKNIQIILPAHNEEENIGELYTRIKEITNPLPYRFELLFVDDGSKDATLEVIKSIAHRDPSVKYIALSRNFGHQNALKAGIDASDAEIIIMMDCDLQHPPYLINDLIKQYEAGFEVVLTKRLETENEGFFKKKTSGLFYDLINTISDTKIEKGSADFRLLSGKSIESLKAISEFDLFLRGLIPWIGFKQGYVFYHPNARVAGQTKYSLYKMISFALKGITAFSIRPLYYAAYLGLVFAGFALVCIPYILYNFYTGSPDQRWATVIAVTTFFGGINLMILGLICIYLGKLFTQSIQRPHYIVKQTNL